VGVPMPRLGVGPEGSCVMSEYIEPSAVRGGERVLPLEAAWPVSSSSAAEFAVEAMESGRTCGYAANDAPLRTQWEREAAERAGFEFGVAVTNGTHAIAVAVAAELAVRGRAWATLRSLFAGPSFTWVPGTYAGVRMGVSDVLDRAPRFVLFDSVSETDWTVDSKAMARWAREHGDVVLGMVAPGLLDMHPELGPLLEAAEAHRLIAVLDGAQYGGGLDWAGLPKPVVMTKSNQFGKLEGVETGDLGAVFTDDRVLAWVMRRVTDCGGEPGGALDPLNGLPKPVLPDGDEFPLVGNYRASGVLGAAALGTGREMTERLPLLRAVRERLGGEIRTRDGLVVFRLTEPSRGGVAPAYGFGAMLTQEAIAELGLNADQWREVFHANGWADDADGYKFGVRRPYPSAHRDPKMRRYLDGAGDFPVTDAITERGLMFHLGHLLRENTPEWMQLTIDRTVADIAGVRRHFGIS
jgi:hypothetical protein